MNILFVADDIDAVGGIQTMIHTLAQHLSRRGHDVYAVGLYANAAPASLPGQPLYRRITLNAPAPGSPPNAPENRRAKTELQRLLKQVRSGVVIMSSVHVSRCLEDLDTGAWFRIGHYHGSYEFARTHYHLDVIRELWPAFDSCVFLSRADVDGFATHADLRGTWIPNPLSELFTSVDAVPAPATPPRILAVGRLTAIKRFDLAIAAFAQAAVRNWQLHLIGDGEQEAALRRCAERPGLTRTDGPQVVFRGRQPAVAMPSEYAAAKMLIVSSEHEGFGMAIAEAAAAGIPTVAFDVSGGVRSLVQHDRTGLLVPPGDVSGLALAIRELVLDAGRRRTLGNTARAAIGTLNPQAVASQWERLLTSLINRTAEEVAS